MLLLMFVPTHHSRKYRSITSPLLTHPLHSTDSCASLVPMASLGHIIGLTSSSVGCDDFSGSCDCTYTYSGRCIFHPSCLQPSYYTQLLLITALTFLVASLPFSDLSPILLSLLNSFHCCFFASVQPSFFFF